MTDISKIVITEKDKTIEFEIERLKPSKQFNLLLKVIGVVAKGSNTASAQVTQVLHNQLKTGVDVPGKEQEQAWSGDSLTLILDAVKGALASLSDTDRDEITGTLLSNVKVVVTPELKRPATMDELDKRFTSFTSIIKLLKEVITANFTKSIAETQ